MPQDKPRSGEIRPFRPPELGEGPRAEPLARGAGPAGDAGSPRPFQPEPFEEGALPPGGGFSSLCTPAEGELGRARREAEALLARAREEAERLREGALREGLATGRREGRRRLEEGAARLEELVGQLAEYKSTLYREARAQTVELCLALVGKILGPLAEADEQKVIRVAERALQLLPDRETLTLRVHPEELKSLIEAKPKILQTFDGIQRLTVLEDPSVPRGGCIVQTPSAEVDARLETQLQELAQTVRNP